MKRNPAPDPLMALVYEVLWKDTSKDYQPVETARAVRAIRFSYAKAEDLIQYLKDGNSINTPFALYRVAKG